MAKKQTITLIILTVLFFIPFFLALWIYESGWFRHLTLTNQGKLMNQEVRVFDASQEKTWRLVYVVDHNCDAACLKSLDTLARVRLALGRRLYHLSLWLFISDASTQQPENLVETLKNMDIHIKTLAKRPASLEKSSVWVVNDEGEVVLTYPDTAKPKAIYADLKRLSAIWRG